MAFIVRFSPDGGKEDITNVDDLNALIAKGWVFADSILRDEEDEKSWSFINNAKYPDFPLRGSFVVWYLKTIKGSSNGGRTKIWDAFYFENTTDAVEFRLRFC